MCYDIFNERNFGGKEKMSELFFNVILYEESEIMPEKYTEPKKKVDFHV